ncbi:hypothetical protein NIES4075_50900 [Tolypothrix sp. NIES-4075]|nr:hypothetical protein NIES4075_50900 [Tolypothrix sp. NIES-4075]
MKIKTPANLTPLPHARCFKPGNPSNALAPFPTREGGEIKASLLGGERFGERSIYQPSIYFSNIQQLAFATVPSNYSLLLNQTKIPQPAFLESLPLIKHDLT